MASPVFLVALLHFVGAPTSELGVVEGKLTALERSLFAAPPPIEVTFKNGSEEGTFAFERAEGVLDETALKALSHFIRCRRTGREKALAPRTVAMMVAAARHFGAERVEVVSGFRAPPYGAPHSRHFLGRAIDFKLPGVKTKRLAAWLWKTFRGVGVGFYPEQEFVHLDVRDVDVRWVDHARSGESGHARFEARPPCEAAPPADAPRLAALPSAAAPVLAALAR